MPDVLKCVVLGGVVLMLGTATYQLLRDAKARREYAATVGAIRWWMVPAAMAHVVVVVVVVILLLAAVPVPSLGWWTLLGGTGNLALGQTGRSGALWRVVGLILPLWIFIPVPMLAHREEASFRHGSEADSTSERIKRQAAFGLGHSVWMGVPIGAGIALIGSSVLYQLVYLAYLNRRLTQTTLVMISPKPTRLDYPPMPDGPHDPTAWDAHHAESSSVVTRNRVLLEEWLEQRAEQTARRKEQMDGLRDAAVAKAAALHAMSNWLMLGFLIAWLMHSH